MSTPSGFCGTCGHGRVMHAFGKDGNRCLQGEHSPRTKGSAAKTGCDCTNWTNIVDTNDARFTSTTAEVQQSMLGVVNDDY